MKTIALVAAVAALIAATPAISAEVAPFGAIPTWSAPINVATGINAPVGTGAPVPTGMNVPGCTWKTNDGAPLCDPKSLAAFKKDGLNPGTSYDGIFSSGGSGAGN